LDNRAKLAFNEAIVSSSWPRLLHLLNNSLHRFLHLQLDLQVVVLLGEPNEVVFLLAQGLVEVEALFDPSRQQPELR